MGKYNLLLSLFCFVILGNIWYFFLLSKQWKLVTLQGVVMIRTLGDCLPQDQRTSISNLAVFRQQIYKQSVMIVSWQTCTKYGWNYWRLLHSCMIVQTQVLCHEPSSRKRKYCAKQITCAPPWSPLLCWLWLLVCCEVSLPNQAAILEMTACPPVTMSLGAWTESITSLWGCILGYRSNVCWLAWWETYWQNKRLCWQGDYCHVKDDGGFLTPRGVSGTY